MSTSATSERAAALPGWPRIARLRILHCLRAPVGGLFRHVRDLATAQTDAGHAVGIICDAIPGDTLSEARLDALRPHLELGLVRMPMRRNIGFSDVSLLHSIRRHAERCRADVIHGHGAKGGAYARFAARALKRAGHGITCCYTPHGGSLHYGPSTLNGRVYANLERHLTGFTDGIIFESTYAARLFEASIGRRACPTRIIHNGVHADELTPRALVPDAADFVFIGELRQLKGVDILLDALWLVHRTWPARVVIAGDGPDAPAFRCQAMDLGLSDDVRFTGPMPARDALALGRCLVMPSRAESLPYVLLEAAGAGVPIIATSVGGVPEIVAGTDTRLVAPNDAIALADAMVEALLHPEIAEDRARRLRASVMNRFVAPAMAEAITAFYAALRDS